MSHPRAPVRQPVPELITITDPVHDPSGHPIGALLRAAAHGVFPPVDGLIEVVPPDRPGVELVVCFTGHAVFATTLDADSLRASGADGYGGAVLPGPLLAMAGPAGVVDNEDVLFLAPGTAPAGTPPLLEDSPGTGEPVRAAAEPLARVDGDLAGHPRLARARRWRTQVRAYGSADAVLILARGVGGLTEASYEVDSARRGRGAGRALLAAARAMVPADDLLVAAAAPGNAASVRAILAAGFVPVGSVTLVRPGRAGDSSGTGATPVGSVGVTARGSAGATPVGSVGVTARGSAAATPSGSVSATAAGAPS